MNGAIGMNANKNRGVSLLEVMIAVLIFSFGLLGLAALQTYSIKVNQGAHFRSQATALASTMLDNIRANFGNVANYYSYSYSSTGCNTAIGAGAQAAFDLATWRQQLACELPQGEGAVARFDDHTVAVCIRWNESRLLAGNDADGASCLADAEKYFKADLSGTGAGIDNNSDVFVVTARL